MDEKDKRFAYGSISGVVIGILSCVGAASTNDFERSSLISENQRLRGELARLKEYASKTSAHVLHAEGV